jgi:putative hemolysin
MLALELTLVVVLTLVNGVLAMSELAVVSSRPARLKTLADQGVRGANAALALSSDPGRFLSTVQIGITLVGILAGAFSGATLGDRLSVWFADLGMPAPLASVFGVGIVVGAITYLSLILGELVPKQLALRDPERTAARVAPAMTLLAKVSAPLVAVLDASGKAVLALLGRKDEGDKRVTEEEIKTLVAEAETAGVLEPSEREMISGVMRLGDRPVRAVMTPRVDVETIDLSAPLAEAIALVQASAHSRFPVHGDDPNEIMGILAARDLVGRTITKPKDLEALIKSAPIIPDSVDALDVVAILKRSAVHIGLVHDEYGHFVGVVTSADILASIVGDFATEEGAAEKGIVRRDDGTLLVAGWLAADEFAETLGLTLPENRTYETAAGFLIDVFGRLPDVGDRVGLQHWDFEVLDLDGRRIDKFLATRRDG